MIKGDIVLVPFPFTDRTGNKYRPAVVLIISDDDITVCFITSKLKWKKNHDIAIEPNQDNGLKSSSLVKLNKITTIDKDLVIGKIGTLSDSDIKLLNKGLKALLKI